MNLEKIIKECGAHQIKAQKALYQLYHKRVFLLCRRFMKTDEDAEDIMLKGFVKVFANMQTLEFINESSFWAWIKKIMINECLMQLRKKENFILSVESYTDLELVDETIFEKLAAAEIYQLINQLPVGYKTVFNLFVIDGFSHKEIAEMLHIQEGTSKSQLSKAKNILQQLISKQLVQHAKKIN
jgi:RNA polymerase sigma factor (sigma-70 family)